MVCSRSPFCVMSSFCFMSLPTAGIVVGLIHILLSVLGSLISIGGLTFQDDYTNAFRRDHPFSVSDAEHFRTAFCTILVTSLSYHVFDLLASIMLVIGTPKRSHFMLLPWLIGNMIALIVKIPLSLVFVYFAVSRAGFSARLPFLMISLISLQCWMWAAVYSLYRDIRVSKEESSESTPRRIKANNYAVFVNSEDPAIQKH